RLWRDSRRAWRATTFDEGPFSVIVSSFRFKRADKKVAAFLGDVPELRDQPPQAVTSLVERVVHVSPQTVAEAISQRDAIRLKEALERRGAKARIKETIARRASTRREPIPEHVRHEVWRRDGGQC